MLHRQRTQWRILNTLAMNLKLRILSFLSAFLFITNTFGAINLTPNAKISLLTCGPGSQIHAFYGHSALRIKDPALGIDHVFNYGIFSFDSNNFIYKFSKGETDYMLAGYSFKRFLAGYEVDNRSVFEQDLNLTMHERQQLFNALQENAKPENRVYRYNFFFDNCATRVRDIVKNNVDGTIAFRTESKHNKTFRQLIDDYQGKFAWVDLGIDLVVGAPADTIAGAYAEMFLPDYMLEQFSEASIIKGNNSRKLASDTKTLFLASPEKERSWLLHPVTIFGVILLIILALSLKQLKAKSTSPRLDNIIYGITGFIGIIVFWFILYSEHPAMRPNWNILWALPTNFIFAILNSFKGLKAKLKWYHKFSAIWLALFLLFSFIIPQSFNPVIYIIAMIVLIRSLLNVIQLKQLRP
ncbi:DUF4105 domain-containing protein [Puteibacter caeruleilacunae]|nr:DUF4105 domain-containing protein [Puteibacter caeruleilacunae]